MRSARVAVIETIAITMVLAVALFVTDVRGLRFVGALLSGTAMMVVMMRADRDRRARR